MRSAPCDSTGRCRCDLRGQSNGPAGGAVPYAGRWETNQAPLTRPAPSAAPARHRPAATCGRMASDGQSGCFRPCRMNSPAPSLARAAMQGRVRSVRGLTPSTSDRAAIACTAPSDSRCASASRRDRRAGSERGFMVPIMVGSTAIQWQQCRDHGRHVQSMERFPCMPSNGPNSV